MKVIKFVAAGAIALAWHSASLAADGAAACVSYKDNAVQARSVDAGATSRYYSGSYAKAVVAQLSAIIGGMPDGADGFASISTDIASVNGVQAVALRFYGPDGCALGATASIAVSLFTLILQQVGTPA